MIKLLFALGCSALLCLSIAATQSPATGYSIVNRISLAGDGGWDLCAFDESGARLFVSHDMQVQVVDAATDKQIGVIPDTKGVHGIALARDLNKVYITNGKDTSVTIVDFKTLAFIKKVHVTGLSPDGIAYDSFSGRVFVLNGKSGNVTVLDSKTDSVVGTIVLDGKPEFPVVNGSGLLYVTLEDKAVVAVVSTKSMKIEKRWSVGSVEEPCAMAIDNIDHRLFIGCHSKVMVVMDATSGKAIASLPIGDHVDAAAYDPGKQLAFFSNGEGTVTVIQKTGKDVYKVKETIVTQKGAKTMAISTTTGHLYLPTAEYDAAPAATAQNPKPRALVKSGSFVVLDIAPVGK